MSALQFPEEMDRSRDVQIWNNIVFDNGEVSEDLKQSWGSLKSVFGNPKESFDSVSDKENRGSVVLENRGGKTPFKPVNKDEVMEKSRIKGVSRKGVDENVVLKGGDSKEIREEKKIDEEIEEVESEICRLKLRLEGLRLEKADRSIKAVEKRGRVVPAKFMDQKQSVKGEEVSSVSARKVVQRRGLSLGPAEIASAGRRGISMGPSEIFGAVKSKQLGKLDMMTPSQSRRKSCFWKLPEIGEEKVAVVAKEKGKSSSVSPKSRRAAAKAQVTSRQAVTTVAARKTGKKEEGVISSIQPKKLFKDGEKSVAATNKKPLRPGKVVASRYNQNASQASAVRKRSLHENDKDESKRCEKKRSLSAEKDRANANESKNLNSEVRVKKRWEIPSEIVVHGSNVEAEKSPQSIVAVPDLLPRIRIARCVNESPRDSGPAKKVVELIGRKSFFSIDEEAEPSICQSLTYAEEEADEES